MRRMLCFAILSMSSLSAGAAINSSVADVDTVQLVTSFNVGKATQVPGKTLKTGNYSIRIVDHLSDRMIVQIEDAKGALQSRFLALENPELRTADRSTGPLAWTNGPDKVNTLRGFAFPGGAAIEFVYPKADAVSIAKVNTSKVPAIDPASEGRVSAKNLSQQDLQTVTLWTLLFTRVGSGDVSQPAIEAARYQAPPQRQTVEASAQALQTAESSGSRGSNESRMLTVHAARRARPPQQTAAVTRPVLDVLPHTASNQGLVVLAGLLALILGGSIRYVRYAGRDV